MTRTADLPESSCPTHVALRGHERGIGQSPTWSLVVKDAPVLSVSAQSQPEASHDARRSPSLFEPCEPPPDRAFILVTTGEHADSSHRHPGFRR
jgi:hypothetical protein